MSNPTKTIRLPNEEFPYNNCVVEQGTLENMDKEKFVFTTISKAGNKRRITTYPNGGRDEEQLGHVE